MAHVCIGPSRPCLLTVLEYIHGFTTRLHLHHVSGPFMVRSVCGAPGRRMRVRGCVPDPDRVPGSDPALLQRGRGDRDAKPDYTPRGGFETPPARFMHNTRVRFKNRRRWRSSAVTVPARAAGLLAAASSESAAAAGGGARGGGSVGPGVGSAVVRVRWWVGMVVRFAE